MRELTIHELEFVSGAKDSDKGGNSGGVFNRGNIKTVAIDYIKGKAIDLAVDYAPKVAKFVNSVPMPATFELDGSDYSEEDGCDYDATGNKKKSGSKIINDYMKQMKDMHLPGAD